jgi:photosystem I P700 chlorophyll a apoprotein A1
LKNETLSAHHLAVVFITSSLVRRGDINLTTIHYELAIPYLSHPSLSINLLFPASNSILFGHQIYALPIYPYVRTDLLVVLCLMYHHITIGGFLIIGAFTHASIFIIGDHVRARSLNHIFSGRDVMISWLIYLGIALGLHSFSLYIHNDTLSTFEREEDMFRDNGIQLKPVFAYF